MATLAKAQTLYRVALSAGLIAAPRLFGRIWSGREADDARGRRDDGGRVGRRRSRLRLAYALTGPHPMGDGSERPFAH